MKQVFVADDGTQFVSAEECQAYEAMAGVKESIHKWAETRFGGKQGQATGAANKVIQWEMDREKVLSGNFEYVEHPKPEKKEKAPEPAVTKAAA